MLRSTNCFSLAGLVIAILALTPGFGLGNPIVNFQGILEENVAVAQGNYNFRFEIWTDSTAGTQVWYEEFTNVPVDSGIYHLNLGASSSLEVLDFSQNTYWMQMKVNGALLQGRQRIAYHLASLWAADAEHAVHADTAAVAGSYTLPEYLANPATLTTVWLLQKSTPGPLLDLANSGTGYAGCLNMTSTNANASDSTFVLNASTTRGVAGRFNVNQSNTQDLYAVEVNAASKGIRVTTQSDVAGYFKSNFLFPTVRIENAASSGPANVLQLSSTSNSADLTTSVLQAITFKGIAGWFQKNTDDDAWTLYVQSTSATSSGEGLYVSGRAVATAGWGLDYRAGGGARTELKAAYAEKQTISLIGSSALSQGRTTVSFSRNASSMLNPAEPLKIFLTPKGGWSGLYVESSSVDGFTVASGAGDANIAFDWLAIGVLKENEITQDEIISPEQRAKLQEMGMGR